jgi:hypothetical protein
MLDQNQSGGVDTPHCSPPRADASAVRAPVLTGAIGDTTEWSRLLALVAFVV